MPKILKANLLFFRLENLLFYHSFVKHLIWNFKVQAKTQM